MSSKPSKLFGFFTRKSKSNKENEQPQQSQDGFARHQSMRGSTRRNRTSHFEETDEYLSPSSINPYHSVGKPRARAPRSCPGGYDDKYNSRYDYEPEGNSQRVRHEKFSRRTGRDTSEYGSGDPSPIAQAGRHHHYNQSLIEDSEDEDEFNQRYLETERRLHDKLKHLEQRRFFYKDQCRRLKQQKEECEGAFHDKMQSLKEQNRTLMTENQSLHAENNMLKQKLNTVQMQLQAYQQQSMFSQCPPSNGGFCQPSAFNYGPLTNLSTPARYGMPQMHIPGTIITPGTSTALETSASGAGEALSQPTDLSFQRSSANFNSSYDSKFDDSKFGVKPIDDEMDEVKHFRQADASSIGELDEDQFEIKRSAVSSSRISLKGQESAASLVRQVAYDSKGSSSTVIVEDADVQETESQKTMRRTASDGAL